MDAREYMAKQGIGQGRDEARPNTLEEKAWARARAAGERPPRAGTPHDWEEWERHHAAMAADAEAIEQKIDPQAHRRASASHQEHQDKARSVPAGPSRGGQSPAPATASAALPDAPAPRAALRALAVLAPPLAVGLAGASRRQLALNGLLTLLGWVPGAVHAWRLVARQTP